MEKLKALSSNITKEKINIFHKKIDVNLKKKNSTIEVKHQIICA
jgi:hypothetical protein